MYKDENRKILANHLRRKRNKRTARKEKKVYRGGIKNRVSISERPSTVNNREEVGHWEGDLIVGKNNESAILTLVERSSRYALIVQIDNRQSHTVTDKIIHFFRQLPPHMRRSLTYDNGIEMSYHERIFDEVQTKVYFANPRSPWQRGTNENTNGLAREFLPKSTDLGVFSQLELGGISVLLNRRPRKVIEFNSPAEVFSHLQENPNCSLSECLHVLNDCII